MNNKKNKEGFTKRVFIGIIAVVGIVIFIFSAFLVTGDVIKKDAAFAAYSSSLRPTISGDFPIGYADFCSSDYFSEIEKTISLKKAGLLDCHSDEDHYRIIFNRPSHIMYLGLGSRDKKRNSFCINSEGEAGYSASVICLGQILALHIPPVE